jgi:hypothetical protein
MYKLHQLHIETEDGVLPMVDWVFKKPIMNDGLFVLHILGGAIRENEIVHALESVPCDGWIFFNHLQILGKTPLPVKVSILLIGVILRKFLNPFVT